MPNGGHDGTDAHAAGAVTFSGRYKTKLIVGFWPANAITDPETYVCNVESESMQVNPARARRVCLLWVVNRPSLKFSTKVRNFRFVPRTVDSHIGHDVSFVVEAVAGQNRNSVLIMTAKSQPLPLPGGENSKISVRFIDLDEMERLLCSQTPNDGFGPAAAALIVWLPTSIVAQEQKSMGRRPCLYC